MCLRVDVGCASFMAPPLERAAGHADLNAIKSGSHTHILLSCRYAELEAKYNEQLRQNQITIHIKDLETREKIKELTEKLALETESEHQRYEALRQQKVEAELEFSERLKSEEARSSDVVHMPQTTLLMQLVMCLIMCGDGCMRVGRQRQMSAGRFLANSSGSA